MAFHEEMRALERNIADGHQFQSSMIMAALRELPPGRIRITEGRCRFIPQDVFAEATRSKTARISHLQRRARARLALAGDACITRDGTIPVTSELADDQCPICLVINDPEATVCAGCNAPISGSDGDQGAEDAESDESAASDPDSGQEEIDDDSSRSRRSRRPEALIRSWPADFGGRAP